MKEWRAAFSPPHSIPIMFHRKCPFAHFQKEEIAKEFDLPERKSKIATIMKHDGEAYCLCRSSDCSRFMM